MGVGQASALNGAVHAIVVGLQRTGIDEHLAAGRTRTSPWRTHRDLQQLSVGSFHTERLGSVLGAAARTGTRPRPHLVPSLASARPAGHVSGPVASPARVHPRKAGPEPRHDRLLLRRHRTSSSVSTPVLFPPGFPSTVRPSHRERIGFIGSDLPFEKERGVRSKGTTVPSIGRWLEKPGRVPPSKARPSSEVR
eukprot:scaffold1368_cov333-Pavlova_lutheri.AAC.13